MDTEFLPGFFGTFNQNSFYTSLNQAGQEWLGLRNTDITVGITHLDIKCNAVEVAHQWIKQDRECLQSDTGTAKFIGYAMYASGWKTVLGEKRAFRLSDDAPIQIACQIMDITNLGLFDITPFLLKKNGFFLQKQLALTLTDNYPVLRDNTRLSVRQSECLFFLIRGKTFKEIAARLGLSPKTIEQYVDGIKYKLRCSSRTELVELALDRGYLNFLPESLLSDYQG